MDPFVEKPLPAPPLMNRAMRIPDPKAAETAIVNLFAGARSVEDVSKSHLADVADRYRLGGSDTQWDLAIVGRSIFAQLLTHYVADGETSDDEVNSLVYVKELFDFTNAEARALHDDAAARQFRLAVDERLGDRQFSDEDRTFLDHLRDQLLLSEERARRETIDGARAVLEAAEREVTENMTLSPAGASELKSMAAALGVEWPTEATGRHGIDRLRGNWNLDRLPLEAIEVDIPLEPDEVSHLSLSGVRLRGLSFAHPANVAPSLQRADAFSLAAWLVTLFGDWLFGSPKAVDDGLQVIDDGRLVLTSDRLRFLGSRVEESLPLTKIRDAQYADSRITVYTHGRPWRIAFVGPVELDGAFVLLRRLIREDIAASSEMNDA